MIPKNISPFQMLFPCLSKDKKEAAPEEERILSSAETAFENLSRAMALPEPLPPIASVLSEKTSLKEKIFTSDQDIKEIFEELEQDSTSVEKITISSTEFDDLAFMGLLRLCPNLQELCLKHSSELQDPPLEELKNLLKLTHIRFEYCEEVSNEMILSLASRCPNLKSFTLEANSIVSDAITVPLIESCPELEEIRFYSCPLITDETFCNVMDRCAKIRNFFNT